MLYLEQIYLFRFVLCLITLSLKLNTKTLPRRTLINDFSNAGGVLFKSIDSIQSEFIYHP